VIEINRVVHWLLRQLLGQCSTYLSGYILSPALVYLRAQYSDIDSGILRLSSMHWPRVVHHSFCACDGSAA